MTASQTTPTPGPHEVVKPCDIPHQLRRGRPCICGGTGWLLMCTICLLIDCDGEHDYCLPCDGTGTVECPDCAGEYDTEGSGNEPCTSCEEGRVPCPDC